MGADASKIHTGIKFNSYFQVTQANQPQVGTQTSFKPVPSRGRTDVPVFLTADAGRTNAVPEPISAACDRSEDGHGMTGSVDTGDQKAHPVENRRDSFVSQVHCDHSIDCQPTSDKSKADAVERDKFGRPTKVNGPNGKPKWTIKYKPGTNDLSGLESVTDSDNSVFCEDDRGKWGWVK